MEENLKTPPSLKSQSAWLLFAKTTGFAFSFLLPLLIVRFLSQAEVGVYRQVFLVIANANAILPLGVAVSAYYYLSREKERRAAAVFNILIFNFAVGGLACGALFFFPQILGNIFQSEEITRLAPRIGIVIWLWIFSSFLETVAVANQEPRRATAFIILAQFTKTLLMTVAVVLFASVEAFIYAAMIQAALQTCVLLVYLNSRFPRFWTKFDFRFFREQLVYALPFGFAGLLWTLQTDIHNYFVGYQFSAAEFAIYAYGCFQIPLISMLSESVASVLIPQMSRLEAEGKKREMLELTARATEKLSLVYFPVYVFLLITAYTFITTLFTVKFAASVPIFLINISLLPFSVFIADPIARAFGAIGRYILKVRILIVVALVLTLFYGIKNFDLKGMALIVVAAALVDRAASTVKIWQVLEIRFSDLRLLKNVGKIGLVSVLAGIPTFFAYYQIRHLTPDFGRRILLLLADAPKESLTEFFTGALTLGLTGLFFAALYAAGIYLAGVATEEEKEFVRLKLATVGRIFGIAQKA